jgi:hypothetical protein
MTHRTDVEPIEAQLSDPGEDIREASEKGGVVRDRPEVVDARVVEPARPGPQPTAASGTSSGAPVALFPGAEADTLRAEWQSIQTGFVDEPRGAVERADELVCRVAERLTSAFGSERAGLEKRWGQGGDVSTEDLRLVLQRYRSFFDRLLSI